jgi:hypothetical protein
LETGAEAEEAEEEEAAGEEEAAAGLGAAPPNAPRESSTARWEARVPGAASAAAEWMDNTSTAAVPAAAAGGPPRSTPSRGTRYQVGVALTPGGCQICYMCDQNSTYGLHSLPGGVRLVAWILAVID